MNKILKEKSNGLFNQVNREIRDLDVEDLMRGYSYSTETEEFTCIFCGKVFEEGVIYPLGPWLLTAVKAVKEHVIAEHGSAFDSLLSMDKQVNGLTDIQKNILRCFYEGTDTEEISERMNITSATVRTHRHNLQRMKREAKILLALMAQLESTERPRPALGAEKLIWEESGGEAARIPGDFAGNTLHPFFTQRRLE